MYICCILDNVWYKHHVRVWFWHTWSKYDSDPTFLCYPAAPKKKPSVEDELPSYLPKRSQLSIKTGTPFFPSQKKCASKKPKATRVFYSFLHVWWRGIIKKNWVSAQIEEKTTSTKQFDWEKTWVSPTHAQVGSHFDSICFLVAVARLSSTAMLKARRPCGTEAPELMFFIFLFFSPSFFSSFGKPSGSRIWNRGFLWILGFHGGKVPV